MVTVTDNIELVDQDYGLTSGSSNRLKTKSTSFSSIKQNWYDFRLNLVQKELNKLKTEAASTYYPSDLSKDIVSQDIANKSYAIARLEAEINILKGEAIPNNYVNSRAIKLRKAMMDNVNANTSGLYTTTIINDDKMVDSDDIDVQKTYSSDGTAIANDVSTALSDSNTDVVSVPDIDVNPGFNEQFSNDVIAQDLKTDFPLNSSPIEENSDIKNVSDEYGDSTTQVVDDQHETDMYGDDVYVKPPTHNVMHDGIIYSESDVPVAGDVADEDEESATKVVDDQHETDMYGDDVYVKPPTHNVMHDGIIYSESDVPVAGDEYEEPTTQISDEEFDKLVKEQESALEELVAKLESETDEKSVEDATTDFVSPDVVAATVAGSDVISNDNEEFDFAKASIDSDFDDNSYSVSTNESSIARIENYDSDGNVKVKDSSSITTVSPVYFKDIFTPVSESTTSQLQSADTVVENDNIRDDVVVVPERTTSVTLENDLTNAIEDYTFENQNVDNNKDHVTSKIVPVNDASLVSDVTPATYVGNFNKVSVEKLEKLKSLMADASKKYAESVARVSEAVKRQEDAALEARRYVDMEKEEQDALNRQFELTQQRINEIQKRTEANYNYARVADDDVAANQRFINRKMKSIDENKAASRELANMLAEYQDTAEYQDADKDSYQK